jgi:hypothetical protein
MIDSSTWAPLSSPSCLVLAPANLGLRPDVSPAPDSDLTFMASAVAIVDDVPMSTILTHRPRTRHLRAEVHQTAEALDEVLEEGPFDVPGASTARWVRGTWVLEEALTPVGHELVSQVVVPVRHDFVSLVVRVPAGNERGRQLADAVLGTLTIVTESA